MEPIQTFTAYTSDAWAIERTLRFFQATFGILAELSSDVKSAAHSNAAKANIHLARRFYRCFKWVDCSVEIFSHPKYDYGGVHESVRMLRDSALMVYFFLDMLLLPSEVGYARPGWLGGFIEDTIGIADMGNAPIEHTALTCWFYAILLSITLGILEISHTPATPTAAGSKKSEKGSTSKEKAVTKKGNAAIMNRTKPQSTVIRELIGNVCDLVIPGVAIGYVKIDPIYVYIAMATSSLLTMNGVWNRIYAEKLAAPS